MIYFLYFPISCNKNNDILQEITKSVPEAMSCGTSTLNVTLSTVTSILKQKFEILPEITKFVPVALS